MNKLNRSIQICVLALITMSSTGCIINNYHNSTSTNKNSHQSRPIQQLRKSLVFTHQTPLVTNTRASHNNATAWYKNRAYRYQPSATPSRTALNRRNQRRTRTIDRQSTHNGRTNNYRSTTTITNTQN